MTAFDKAWEVVKRDLNEIPDDEWEEGNEGFSCPDCGYRHEQYGVCDDCWEVRQNTDQEGDEHGVLPPHLHDTPLHDEGLEQLYRGMTVDWDDGNVNNPEMRIALYNLYDYYDSETGQPKKGGYDE